MHRTSVEECYLHGVGVAESQLHGVGVVECFLHVATTVEKKFLRKCEYKKLVKKKKVYS